MSIVTIDEVRLEMRRTYSFGERTFFPGRQRPTQADPDLLEKANYCSLQDKAVLRYFLWSCSVLPSSPEMMECINTIRPWSDGGGWTLEYVALRGLCTH